MKTLLPRLLDRLLPWRVVIRAQAESLALLSTDNVGLRRELETTTRERDTARRQFAETRAVNHTNAAAHRATEVAMLHQNHKLQVAEARLAGRPVLPELAAAAEEFPPPRMPRRIPVTAPKSISASSNPNTKSP